ncbi:hypothetical protein [Streptomyces sp. WZ-12]|uniref:hypothetical protein n=1 Tax=Streptomyces sp. WZ-12 TaxID=3030210 RepID=UPI0031586A25
MWLPLLLLARGAAVASCARVCRTAVVAAGRPRHGAPSAPADDAPADDTPAAVGGLSRYESASPRRPHRLADVALVLMAQQRRLHLAHTGRATLVAPVGLDPVERAALTAIGRRGSARYRPCGTPCPAPTRSTGWPTG